MTAAMTEHEFETILKELIEGLGLYGYHNSDSRRSARGWPDWVIVGRRVLYRELKSQYGTLTSEQRRIGYLLRAAGQNWKVWRPSDLISGRVAAELTDLIDLSRYDQLTD